MRDLRGDARRCLGVRRGCGFDLLLRQGAGMDHYKAEGLLRGVAVRILDLHTAQATLAPPALGGIL
jgi:hypothetical protein